MSIKVPVTSAVKASLVVQDITYTAVLRGTAGNSISITYTSGGTAGSEVVTVSGNDISIQIEDGVSTATQVKAAFDAESDATDLASAAITGTAGNAQDAATIDYLENGTNPTAAGLDASQVTSITETAVGSWLIIFKYPFHPNGEVEAMVSSLTAGANCYESAVDHDRLTVSAVDTTDGSTAIDANFRVMLMGNDNRMTY